MEAVRNTDEDIEITKILASQSYGLQLFIQSSSQYIFYLPSPSSESPNFLFCLSHCVTCGYCDFLSLSIECTQIYFSSECSNTCTVTLQRCFLLCFSYLLHMFHIFRIMSPSTLFFFFPHIFSVMDSSLVDLQVVWFPDEEWRK